MYFLKGYLSIFKVTNYYNLNPRESLWYYNMPCEKDGVAVNNNRIVAVIIGTARFKNIITIDIETEDKHRNKGLAIALTQHFLNECINRGFIAQWDCMDSNIASKRTAERAGFHFLRKNIVYWFKI